MDIGLHPCLVLSAKPDSSRYYKSHTESVKLGLTSCQFARLLQHRSEVPKSQNHFRQHILWFLCWRCVRLELVYKFLFVADRLSYLQCLRGSSANCFPKLILERQLSPCIPTPSCWREFEYELHAVHRKLAADCLVGLCWIIIISSSSCTYS